MNLRLDELLADLRHRTDELLRAIDTDPMLVRKEFDGLVLANAGSTLFTPTEPHQLYAKGIVYRRDPYRLVSLPLIKIYNLNERDFITLATFSDLIRSAPTDRPCRLHFLRKYDGSLVQRFQEFGRVAFTTRGGLERARDPARELGFDYIGAARLIASESYPVLLEDHADFEGLTLVFEFLHPEAQIITHYGDRRDLLLTTVLDRREYRYWTHDEVTAFAAKHGLTPVDAYTPTGATLSEQIDSLLASIRGTDEEGAVIALEFGDQVVYRVKVKSPDYLRLLRLMVDCTYAATAAMLDADPAIRDLTAFEEYIKSRGSDSVPEEVLGEYRAHFTAHQRYLADIDRLVRWVESTFRALQAELPPGGDRRAERKAFAARAQSLPHNALLFAAMDGKLNRAVARKLAPTPDEVRAALVLVGEISAST